MREAKSYENRRGKAACENTLRWEGVPGKERGVCGHIVTRCTTRVKNELVEGRTEAKRPLWGQIR